MKGRAARQTRSRIYEWMHSWLGFLPSVFPYRSKVVTSTQYWTTWTASISILCPPRREYLAAHVTFKKKKILSSGWHSTFIFLDLEICFPLPPPSIYIFILLWLLPNCSKICFLAIWEVRTVGGGEKKWGDMWCCHVSMETLPKDKTRGRLVMFSSAHTSVLFWSHPSLLRRPPFRHCDPREISRGMNFWR